MDEVEKVTQKFSLGLLQLDAHFKKTRACPAMCHPRKGNSFLSDPGNHSTGTQIRGTDVRKWKTLSSFSFTWVNI